MAIKVCDHSEIYILPLLSTGQILGQTDRLAEAYFSVETIFAVYWRMSLKYVLWASNLQDFTLHE